MWQRIADNKIRHVWKCAVCDLEIIWLTTDYPNFGIPKCPECGKEPGYMCTEVDITGTVAKPQLKVAA